MKRTISFFKSNIWEQQDKGEIVLKSRSGRLVVLKKTFELLGGKKALFYRLLIFKNLDLLLVIINPFFYYIFINHVIVEKQVKYLPCAIIGYLTIFLLQTVLIKFTRESYNTLFLKLKLELRVDILKRYINMNANSYRKYGTGDLVNRIERDVELFETFLKKHVIDYIFSITAILVISIILFILNPILTIIGFIAIPFSFWFVQIISKKANLVSEERRKFEGEYESFLNHAFQNWADIKTNNLETCMADEFSKYRSVLTKLIIKSQIYIAFNWLFIAFKDYFITRMNLYFFGGLLIIYKKLTVGILLTFMDYFIQLVNNITSAVNSILDFSAQKPNIERVFEILDLQCDAKKRTVVLGDKIVFSKVSFRYFEKQNLVINSLDFTIQPGEHIAIVGKSGCGKTTLINLLTGVYELCSGEILIGNERISELSHESISKKIGVVTQFSKMLNLTIKENLLLANRHAGVEEIRNACEKANILLFIEGLPQKFDTNIGERGVKLSGGQKQRLAIARLLLQNPDIIIFDESTSSLDSHSENEILKTIRLLSDSKTIITIAHRLSTVLICDKVALMEKGKIVAIETPSDMFTNSSKFSGLFKQQYSSINNY